MKIGLKQAIKFTLLSIWCAGLSLGVLALHQSIFPPISNIDLNKLEQAFNLALQHEESTRSESIEQLFNAQEGIKSQLNSDQLVLQAITERQNNLENALDETESNINHSFSQKFEAIEQHLNKKLSKVQNDRARLIERQKPKVVQVSTSKPVITPPFILFDVQKRGSVYLAIIGKPSAKTLSDLLPLRVGQSYLGWRIVQIRSNSIVANFQGELIDIEVRS